MRRVNSESGQMMPIYVVLILAVISLGALVFQVGRAATLSSDAQTAADAAALAGAKELSEQLYSADGSISGLDEDAVESAARDYAEENGSELTEFSMNACGIEVEVATMQELDGDEAEEVDADGDTAEGLAAAAMGTDFGGSGGAFGAPADGAVPPHLEPAAKLAASYGLQVTSTTGGNHTTGSLHYSGLAIDVSNSNGPPTAEQAAFYEAAKRKFDGFILELFYTPKPAINNNVEGGTIGDHNDHVHIALSKTKISGAPSLESQGGSGSGGFLTGSGVAGPQLVEYETVSECTLGSVQDLLALSSSGYSGFTPSPSSTAIAKAVCEVGNDLGVSDKIMLAAFETAIVETGVRNLPSSVSDLDSAGVFQQRPSQGWGSEAQVTSVPYAANAFFTRAIDADNSGLTPGQLAQEVQRSAYPLKYDAAESDARGLMRRVGCSAEED